MAERFRILVFVPFLRFLPYRMEIVFGRADAREVLLFVAELPNSPDNVIPVVNIDPERLLEFLIIGRRVAVIGFIFNIRFDIPGGTVDLVGIFVGEI